MQFRVDKHFNGSNVKEIFVLLPGQSLAVALYHHYAHYILAYGQSLAVALYHHYIYTNVQG
jgi:hypothetical protein